MEEGGGHADEGEAVFVGQMSHLFENSQRHPVLCPLLPHTHKGPSSGAVPLAAPDHSRLRSLCRRYGEMVSVLQKLDGSCMARLRQVYSQAVNMLIRYEAVPPPHFVVDALFTLHRHF